MNRADRYLKILEEQLDAGKKIISNKVEEN